MKNKYLIGLGIATIVILFFIFSSKSSAPPPATATTSASNISVRDGKQIIEITAKGGYYPRENAAVANMPTVLKLKTSGTFDCSAAFTVPSVKFRAFLPPTGETLVDIGTPKPGTSLRGVCSMGMYSFTVNFN